MKKISFAIVLCMCVSLFTGCSFLDSNVKKSKEIVNKFLEGYQMKKEDINFLLDENDYEDMSYQDSAAVFAENMQYEIDSVEKVNDEQYVVKVSICNIKFEDLFTKAYEKASEENVAEDISTLMSELAKDKEIEKYETKCNIVVNVTEDGLSIRMDDKLANALTGGMNEYLTGLQKGE